MPRYNYTARDKSGKRVSDTLFAVDEFDLADKLSHSGFILVSAKEDILTPGKKDIKIKPVKILNFTLQLASFLKGGLRLLDALSALSQDTKDKELLLLIISLKDYIEAGGSLKDALSLYPKTFSKLYISTIGAGEKTGKLDASLEEMAEYLEWQLDLKAKVIELAMYPAVILVVMTLVVGVLVGFVLPKLEPILKELGAELPLPTKIVLGVSHFFTNYWYILIIIVALSVVGIKLALRNSTVRFYFDKFKLRIPLLGDLANKICIARLCRSMSLGLSSGVSIIETLDLGKDVVGNAILSQAIVSIKDSVSTGGQLSVGFSVSKVFPPVLVRMVEVGERSGALAGSMKKVYEFYDKEIPRIIKRIFSVLEPLLIVLMGLVVGGIAVAVFMPLVKLTQVVGA